MTLRPHVVRLLLIGILFAFDRLFARLCVEVDAAGALLSPGGPVPLAALGAAALFLLTRLSFIVLTAATGGLFVSWAMAWALERTFARDQSR